MLLSWPVCIISDVYVAPICLNWVSAVDFKLPEQTKIEHEFNLHNYGELWEHQPSTTWCQQFSSFLILNVAFTQLNIAMYH